MSKKERLLSNTSSSDITERKRMEETLKESEEKFRTFMETASDLMHIADKDGKLTYVNESMARTLGYSKQEMIGKHVTQFLAKEIVEKDFKIKWDELITKGAIDIEATWITKDGKEIYGEIKVVAVYDSDGNYAGSRAVFRDLTERKRVEEKLRLFSHSIESSVDGVALGDLNGRITYANEAFVRIFGYSKEELIGKEIAFIYSEEQIPKLKEAIKATMEGGWTGELIGKRKDGEVFPMAVSSSRVVDDKGNVIAQMANHRDITERKRMERELQEKNEQLDAQNEELRSQSEELMVQQQELMEKTREVEKANRLKSDFLANMSHELRSPLNVIIGFSELMTDEVPGKINEEQRQCLSDVLSSSKHLLNLINDVLDLSKIESGKVELRLTNIALTEIIESLSRTMAPILTPRKQSLDIEIEEGLPPIHADKAKLKQVLINLVDNATKFTPDGGRLRIKAVRESDWCRVSVIDNGTGIKKEDQEQIFEPFCRLNDPLAREKTGTGLGLALVKQIVERYGGRAWVESEYGKGSRFTFTVPLATSGQPNPEEGNKR